MGAGSGGLPGYMNVPNYTSLAQMMPGFQGAGSDAMLGSSIATSNPSSLSSTPPATDPSSNPLSSPAAMQSAQNTIRSMNTDLVSGLPGGTSMSNPWNLPAGFFQNTAGIGKG